MVAIRGAHFVSRQRPHAHLGEDRDPRFRNYNAVAGGVPHACGAHSWSVTISGTWSGILFRSGLWELCFDPGPSRHLSGRKAGEMAQYHIEKSPVYLSFQDMSQKMAGEKNAISPDGEDLATGDRE